jgi:hypothetical protein
MFFYLDGQLHTLTPSSSLYVEAGLLLGFSLITSALFDYFFIYLKIFDFLKYMDFIYCLYRLLLDLWHYWPFPGNIVPQKCRLRALKYLHPAS